jgi:hypothetical protein
MKTSGMRAALLSAALIATAGIAHGQSPVYIPIDGPASQFVDALVARGALPSLSALERPYPAGAVRDAVDSALARADRGAISLTAPRRWYDAASRAAIRYAGPGASGDSAAVGRGLAASAEVDPFFTAQSTGHRELMLGDKPGGGYPGADIRLALGAGNFAAVSRLRLDRALRVDPEFAGKKDRATAARMEEAYLGAQWRYVTLVTGRVSRSWGPAPLDGLQVGSYADSYDHLYFRLGTSGLNLTSIVARLDDMAIGTDTVAQRYFTAHRIGARWRGLDVAATEAIIYGGPGRGFEPSLANPASLLDLAQYTDHQSLNVSYALDAAFRTTGHGLYGAQFLVDDFQVDNCGTNCSEPSSIGVTLLAEAVPTGTMARAFGSYTRVNNLTYRAPNPWERYSYLGVGLGRGQSDYDELRAGLELAPPLGGPLRLYAATRRQGEGDYRLPFPRPAQYATTPAIFAGVVEHTHRAGAQWTTSGRIALTADVGYDWTRNADHVAGRTRNGFVGRMRIALDPALVFTRSLTP